MTKEQIRKWLKDNRGKAARIAEELGIHHSTLSMWLSGRSPSSPLDKAVPPIIRRLMAEGKKKANGGGK